MTDITDALHVAIDLGAGSGRTLVGGAGHDGLRFSEVHRFHYAPRPIDGHLRWDAAALLEGIRTGLERARDAAGRLGARLVSVGVDSWGVDYALVDAEGALVEEPVCYRDPRTDRAMDEVFTRVPATRSSAAPASSSTSSTRSTSCGRTCAKGLPPRAAHLLLMPDFCHHALCGSLVSERTNASTTQLLNATTGRWDDELFARLGLPRRLDAGGRECGHPHRHVEAGALRCTRGRATVGGGAGHARHGERGRRHAARARLGLHLVRHVVAGRRRARDADALGRGRARRSHKRSRRLRKRAPAHKCHGPVAAGVVPARVGSRGERAGTPGTARRRREAARPRRRHLPG